MNNTNGMRKILIVDDQPEILNTINRLLKRDYTILTAGSGQIALKLLLEQKIAVILSDQRMPKMDGATFLQKAMQIQPEAIRILITGYSDINATIDAVNKAQIYQYVSKPFEPDDLKHIITRAMEHYRLTAENKKLQEKLKRANILLQKENETLSRQVEKELDLSNIIGGSPAILKVFKLVKKVANTPTTVLIEGETGTGKELTAKLIHYNSDRKKNMFVVQNCGAIPDTLLQSELFGHTKGAFTGASQAKKGLFELADKGTIFLDEIGDTTPALQLSLLRALQEGEIKPLGAHHAKKVDVRVIAATNKNLQEEVEKGNFREDLFYRLYVFPIPLPPLRERTEDIPDLAQHFIKKYIERIGKNIKGISDDVLEVFSQSRFPGNIRELENEIERMVTLAEDNKLITIDLLSARFHKNKSMESSGINLQGGLKKTVEGIEKTMIGNALMATGGNILQAAGKLGISRVGLHKMIKRYDILPEKYKHK